MFPELCDIYGLLDLSMLIKKLLVWKNNFFM